MKIQEKSNVKLRERTDLLSEKDLLFAVAGQLYAQAPNGQPRKADVIMSKVKEKFRERCSCLGGDYFYTHIESNKLYDYLKELLLSIPEFNELNLSQIEFENNVKVDDESRPKYSFTSMYDVKNEDSWKDDFIDLDAFIRNVHGKIFDMIFEKDCFLCVNAQTKECETCYFNPNLKDNYQSSRAPKGRYTMSCTYDCVQEGNYICCCECDKKDTCENKCEGSHENCGLVLHVKNNNTDNN